MCVLTTIYVHAPSVLNYRSKCILMLVCNVPFCVCFVVFIWLLANAFSPSAQSTSLFFSYVILFLFSTTCVVKIIIIMSRVLYSLCALVALFLRFRGAVSHYCSLDPAGDATTVDVRNCQSQTLSTAISL